MPPPFWLCVTHIAFNAQFLWNQTTKESKCALAPKSQRSIGSPGHHQEVSNTTKYPPKNTRRGQVTRINLLGLFLHILALLSLSIGTCFRCRKAPHRVSDCPEPLSQGDEDTAPPSKTARMSKPGSSSGLQ